MEHIDNLLNVAKYVVKAIEDKKAISEELGRSPVPSENIVAADYMLQNVLSILSRASPSPYNPRAKANVDKEKDTVYRIPIKSIDDEAKLDLFLREAMSMSLCELEKRIGPTSMANE